MILRSFLYHDTKTTSDYLAQLQGGITESYEKTASSELGKSGSLGLSQSGIKVDKQRMESQISRQVVNAAANFSQLYALLESENMIQRLEAFDDQIWQQISPGEIIEVPALFRISQLHQWIKMFDDVAPLVSLSKTLGTPLDDVIKDSSGFDTDQLFGIMNQIKATVDGKSLPIIFESTGVSGYSFVADLLPKFLNVEYSDLVGEAVILCKVSRIVPADGQIIVSSLFGNLYQLLNQPNETASKKVTLKNSIGNNALNDVVSGPAMKVIPLAVYR